MREHRKVSAAEAKAHLSELVSEVAYRGERVVIERRGKPLAALVGLEDLGWLEQQRPTQTKPPGFLALVGAWGDLGDDVIDAFIADIYSARESDTGRPVELEP